MRFDLFCSFINAERAKAEKEGRPVKSCEPRAIAIWICIYEGWPELFLWAGNNIFLFTFLMKAHGVDLVGKDSAKIRVPYGSVPRLTDLPISDNFRHDENFREFIHNLITMSENVDSKTISGRQISKAGKGLINDFFNKPSDPSYLDDIPITGIP